MRVIEGSEQPLRRTQIEDARDQFRLERQGNRVSPRTLQAYDYHLGGFLAWLRREAPNVRQMAEMDIGTIRAYRAEMATRTGAHGRQLSGDTLQDSHAALRAFFRWADNEGYQVDPRILKLPRIRVPETEPTVYHVSQVHSILAACNADFPEQQVAVRILVGSGVRISELCGLCVEAPDGLSDLMLDSLDRGRVELRVRWDAGAKGRKSRRVPITPKLAAFIKRYQSRQRPDLEMPQLLLTRRRTAYTPWGVDTMLGRLQRRTGFRIHAHAFRHTFATAACQLGWNFERLRAAMGHAGYDVLQRYVRLATERDLGRKADWAEFILSPEDLNRR